MPRSSERVEQLKVGVAVMRLANEVKAGRLPSEVLFAVLTGPTHELSAGLTDLGGQLGYSWEIEDE